MLTAEQKRLWLARLRDPNSKQNIGSLFENSDMWTKPTQDGNLPMCCLGHGTFAMFGSVSVANDYHFFCTHIPDHSSILQQMNDKGTSLSMIADWIEENIPTSL